MNIIYNDTSMIIGVSSDSIVTSTPLMESKGLVIDTPSGFRFGIEVKSMQGCIIEIANTQKNPWQHLLTDDLVGCLIAIVYMNPTRRFHYLSGRYNDELIRAGRKAGLEVITLPKVGKVSL